MNMMDGPVRKDRISLKYKLLAVLIAVSIVPISLVSYTSESFMFHSSTQYSASISSQYVRFVAKDITSYLNNLNESCTTLFTSWDFQRFLEIPANDLPNQAISINNFRPILNNSLQFHNEIVGVLYLDNIGKSYFYSYQQRFNPGYSFQNDPLYRTFTHMKTQHLSLLHNTPYLVGTQEPVFSFVRPVIDFRTGKITACVVFEIEKNKILDMLNTNRYSQSGRLFLYYPGGSIVSSTKMDSSLLYDFRYSLSSEYGNNGDFLFKSGGVTYEATYTEIPYGNIRLVWLAPMSSITKGVNQSFNLTLLIAIASLAVSLIITFPVMNTFLKPLFTLKNGLQNLGRGSYTPIRIKYGNDEIGYVIQSYNQMLNQLQIMEQEVFQAKIKEKERELLQLQAQINPHFLFNTLETIESYAIKNNGLAVGEMVQAVSRMMRYSVRNDGGWAPLKEEIAYIRDFLLIHHYRHNRDVLAQVDLDPDSLEIPIMKLSIQPFVENAIKYGWSPSMKPKDFVLSVKTELKDKMLHISVINTGTGIPPEIQENLDQLIVSKGEKIEPYFTKHTGIYNIYRRFLLAYGNDVGFSIRAEHERTIVMAVVPLRT